MIRFVLRAALLGSVVFFALNVSHAADMRSLLLQMTDEMCIAQDATNKNSRYGRLLESSSTYAANHLPEHDPLAMCAREKRWIPQSLCATSLEVDLESREAMDAWFSANRDEFLMLRPIFEAIASNPRQPCELQRPPNGA